MTPLEALLVSIVLGLGTARAAAGLTIDEITAPLRDLIFHWYPPEDNEEHGWFYQTLQKVDEDTLERRREWNIPWWQKYWEPAGEPVRDPAFLGRLLSCHKCVAVWVAAFNVAFYFIWQDAALVLNTFLAAAHVSAVMNKNLYD
jgi:hypothetical protein